MGSRSTIPGIHPAVWALHCHFFFLCHGPCKLCAVGFYFWRLRPSVFEQRSLTLHLITISDDWFCTYWVKSDHGFWNLAVSVRSPTPKEPNDTLHSPRLPASHFKPQCSYLWNGDHPSSSSPSALGFSELTWVRSFWAAQHGAPSFLPTLLSLYPLTFLCL